MALLLQKPGQEPGSRAVFCRLLQLENQHDAAAMILGWVRPSQRTGFKGKLKGASKTSAPKQL